MDAKTNSMDANGLDQPIEQDSSPNADKQELERTDSEEHAAHSRELV